MTDLWSIDSGEAVGETFMASTTEILSITAWRAAYWTYNGSKWRVFVMGIDADGGPDVTNIIRDGPVVQVPYGDGVHPTEFHFVFDPPVTLPAPGTYSFAVQGDSCVGIFDVAANRYNDYPDGILWNFGRLVTECPYRPRYGPAPRSDADLVFTIEFCVADTPVKASSWGKIKSLYR